MTETATQEKPVKAKQQSAPPPAKPRDMLSDAKDDPWHPMTTAPKNGMYVFLKGDDLADAADEVMREWFWYTTRQFRKGMWQQTGWWRRRFGPNAPPSFTPEGWRYVKDGMPA